MNVNGIALGYISTYHTGNSINPNHSSVILKPFPNFLNTTTGLITNSYLKMNPIVLKNLLDKLKYVCICLLFFFSCCCVVFSVYAQRIDTSANRVKTNFSIPFKRIGSIKPRTTHEIKSSNWILGCETLDRDMADYEQYKEYIAPLGIKRLRMQAGWAKTEK